MKLTSDELGQIRILLRKEVSTATIADKFGCSRRLIQKIAKGELHAAPRQQGPQKETPVLRVDDGAPTREKLKALQRAQLDLAADAQARGNTKEAAAWVSMADRTTGMLVVTPHEGKPEDDRIEIVITGKPPNFKCHGCGVQIDPYRPDDGGKPEGVVVAIHAPEVAPDEPMDAPLIDEQEGFEG